MIGFCFGLFAYFQLLKKILLSKDVSSYSGILQVYSARNTWAVYKE